MCTLAKQHQAAAICLNLIAEEGLIAEIERKAVKRTALIYDFIASSPDPVTMRQVIDEFGLKYGIASDPFLDVGQQKAD